MMSAYLEPAGSHSAIFGRDMLNDPEMRELFQQLTGILDDKPFECVGTRDEVNTAICMSIRARRKRKQELPLLFARNIKRQNTMIFIKIAPASTCLHTMRRTICRQNMQNWSKKN
jgi:hypothetical protein